MLTMPIMIEDAAEIAGMKVPHDMDNFKPEEYPHFSIYCKVQLGVPVHWGNHWKNAEIIARIPDDKIRKITYRQLTKLGFSP